MKKNTIYFKNENKNLPKRRPPPVPTRGERKNTAGLFRRFGTNSMQLFSVGQLCQWQLRLRRDATVISKRLCRSFDCCDTAGLPPPPFWRQLLINHVAKYRGVDILGYLDIYGELKCSLVFLRYFYSAVGDCELSTSHHHGFIHRCENSGCISICWLKQL